MVFCYAEFMTADDQTEQTYDWDREAIQAQWHAFDFDCETPLSDIEANYCRHYRLDFANQLTGSQHRFGYVDIDGYQLATHYYLPAEKARGTVLALHGYFDHSGLNRNLIEFCLQRQYAVLTFDLPGHGLSTGGKGEIDDFLEYVQVLAHYVRLCKFNGIQQPLYLTGISTGGAIIMEYLAEHQFTAETNPFASIVLLAPLVRPVQWHSILVKYQFMRLFVSSVERSFVESSHDRQFLHFLEHSDPLQNRRVAASWIGALIRWVKRFKRARIALSPAVIQGGEDETIDWRYNLKMIRRNFVEPSVHFIPEARHHLVNESEEIRRKVFEFMALYLP